VEDIRYVQAPPQLLAIKERTAALQFSMASEPLVGAMLRTLVASKPGGRFLELGTGTGVATAWLLEGMDERSTLISVDNKGAVQAVARDSLGADNRLTLVTTGELDFLRGHHDWPDKRRSRKCPPAADSMTDENPLSAPIALEGDIQQSDGDAIPAGSCIFSMVPPQFTLDEKSCQFSSGSLLRNSVTLKMSEAPNPCC